MENNQELTAEKFWSLQQPMKSIPDAISEYHELKSKEENNVKFQQQVEISKQRTDSFTNAVKPIIKWLCENCDPHHSIIVTPIGAELLSGKSTTGYIDEYIVD